MGRNCGCDCCWMTTLINSSTSSVSPESLWPSLNQQNIAGAKSPRASNARDGDTSGSEPWGEEARFFTESRLLQRAIKVRLLSAPASLGASPFQSGPTPAAASGKGTNGGQGLPAPTTGGASVIIGMALHPNGNIAEFLCSAGLAKVIDVSESSHRSKHCSTFRLARSGTPASLRNKAVSIVFEQRRNPPRTRDSACGRDTVLPPPRAMRPTAMPRRQRPRVPASMLRWSGCGVPTS